ncbi:DNA-binding MarR family transcriptional regulator [Hephaestia caeni]|uniref:DNA-binding MarR family transcriptional regulator n=1 Tax=Hephaestia caeni TaxID=645617 RepID=A0A397NW33_9SPHN|nr:MarR family winged helix-turn-helix transcriptional regulator [Hephaestia caeni]RIA37954.1 DNA-binding MarR family transcriptional regulator [Hephaestia caeni]
MISSSYLIVQVLQAFEWFDESLQISLRELGWPPVTRPESMVMMHVTVDVVRPADIARSLRLTRQAVHSTIGGMVDRGIFELVPDPSDGRIKIVQLTEMGTAMRRDAQKIANALTEELRERLGAKHLDALATALERQWGDPVVANVDGGPDVFFQEKLRIMAGTKKSARASG